MTRRTYGDGSVDQRGDSFRLRYRVGKQRFSVTFKGTRKEAQTKLRELLRSGDTGEHVEPTKMTLAKWAQHWLSIGCPSSRHKKRVGGNSLVRYAQVLRVHVIPVLGERRLQQLSATEIDRLYEGLERKGLASRTQHQVHSVLNSLLSAAMRKGLLTTNPINRAERIPAPGESNHGQVLDAEQLNMLLQDFKGSALYEIVAVAVHTGARRNEILALQWRDLDPVAKTLRIERSVEETKGQRRLKGPKREKHKRTISVDDALIRLLLSIKEQHLRLVAGVPGDAQVDLSLIKLPQGALIFPSPCGDLDLTRPRRANTLTRCFEERARKRFPGLRFHDLRGSHETALLDAGVAVHTVADRCGHDPAVLLRSYAKRTKKADADAARIMGNLGILS
jgi:integrase